jgi:hypothetical protein
MGTGHFWVGPKGGCAGDDLRFGGYGACTVEDAVIEAVATGDVIGAVEDLGQIGTAATGTCIGAQEDRADFGIGLRGRKRAVGEDKPAAPWGIMRRQWRQGLLLLPVAIWRSGVWPLAAGAQD